MDIILYGIPNCSSVKKARDWLAQHQVDYVFHDFKKAGVSQALLDGWLKEVTWETLLNRQGTTWRKLPDETKAGVLDAHSACAVMLAHSSSIKRPVMSTGKQLLVGFDEGRYRQAFSG